MVGGGGPNKSPPSPFFTYHHKNPTQFLKYQNKIFPTTICINLLKMRAPSACFTKQAYLTTNAIN